MSIDGRKWKVDYATKVKLLPSLPCRAALLPMNLGC